jgi:hypothetical protein
VSTQFDHFQSLPSDGCHAAELFESNGYLFLALANFGDRLQGRYEALSTLWILQESINASPSTSTCVSGERDDSSTAHCELPPPPPPLPNQKDHPTEKSRQLQFNQIAVMSTYGATDIEHFTLLSPDSSPHSNPTKASHTTHFLAVSEEGNLGMGLQSPSWSHVYHLKFD